MFLETLGSAVERFVESFSPAPDNREVQRAQRVPLPVPLKEELNGPKGVMVAYRVHGYRLRDIADVLGVHYTTVSRRLLALENGKR